MARSVLGLRRLAAAGALLLALPLAAHAQVLATFANGETITSSELDKYVSRRTDLRGATGNYWGAEEALREMALTRALVLEGGKMGVERRSKAGDDRFDDIYALAVYKRVAPVCERPADDAAAKAWYEAHPEAFVLPPTARLTRVILPLGQKIGGQSAMSWLFEQATRISQGKTTLDEVVAQAEQVYKLDAQGDLGWVQLEGDSAVMRALDAAGQGDLLGPVQEGSFGYLFYIQAKRNARQLTWDEVRSSAARRAEAWCRQQAREQVQEKLFAQYGVTLDEKAVRALFSDDAAQEKAGS